MNIPKGFCKARVKGRLVEPPEADCLQAVLALASIEVSLEEIASWTPLQCALAEEWACQVHLSASDNSHVRVPPKPGFLPDYAALDLEKMGFGKGGQP